MTDGEIKTLRLETEQIFYHGYDNYMKYAFPEDELRPITCRPLTRDRSNPAHIEVNDALGNYSLTLIDSLSTLAILASTPSTKGKRNKSLDKFQEGVAAVVRQYGDGSEGRQGIGLRGRGFDVDSKVQVFETVIRGVGGLLSAHLFAVGELPIRGYNPKKRPKAAVGDAISENYEIQWSKAFSYDGQLLRLALDLAKRLLPAFYTATGLPYPRVNLRHGVPFYPNSPMNFDAERGQCRLTPPPSGEITETCSAGAGSLVLEFTTLSRLTRDPRFEQLGKRAFWAIWERRSNIGLIGSGVDAETGLWTSSFTGIGAGIDSFFEYALKSYVLFSGLPPPDTEGSTTLHDSLPSLRSHSNVSDEQHAAESFLQVWQESHAAIRRYLYRSSSYIHPHYVQADMFTGAARAFWIDALSAYFPGLLTMIGDTEEAVETHLLFTALWTRYSALPERWSTATGAVEGGLTWWLGRPEFIESTYHLYRTTRDPWYLHVGEMTLRDIKRRCWTRCGWSGIQDVRTGERNDRMESFFLGETAKYLFLLFDPTHPLNHLDAPFVFSTEGHPLIIPRPIMRLKQRPRRVLTTVGVTGVPKEAICPLPPDMVPFTLSATAARKDIFHAASLARLHLMPKSDNLESPMIEFSSDHPSISLSDVRSPSNYTYFPWTLPLELVPHDGFCSKVAARPTFDITFPALPNMVLGPGALKRVVSGILVNSMGGLRLGMIQDVPISSGGDGDGDMYRVQVINNIPLGKDEKIFLAKDVVSDVVNPQDPNFTRIRDTAMLDIVVDTVAGQTMSQEEAHHVDINDTITDIPDISISQEFDEGSEAASNMRVAFSSLFQQVTAMLREQPRSADSPHRREYIPAITPTGSGAAPIPDVVEALGSDVTRASQGPLLWHSIYVTDENCGGKLPASVAKEHQVIVIKRGLCSFMQKLENIPSFAPSPTALQLVVMVSFEDDDELTPGWLIRPLLESPQFTSSGLPRQNPIPMVLVGGGQPVYGVFQRAVGVGIKRRYTVHAQGVPISNLIII